MTSERLPNQPGEWIDRSREVEFRFEGRQYFGYVGDVLSSALWASGVRLFGRSFKYHRPRGLYSLANHDANLMVEDGTRTNLRGDMLAIEAGLDVHAVNTLGGLERDRLRFFEKFARFLPVGFYYKAFHTPRRLFPFYENRMREVAGLGRIRPDTTSQPSPKDYAFCDLLVVGSGPSGLAGALAAAENGADVLIVEEQPRPGGSLSWQHAGQPETAKQRHDLLSRVESADNIRLRCGTQAAGCYGDHWVGLVDDDKLTKLRAKALLVATGSIEQPAVFQNNDLPGVMLGSAAQRLIHLYAVKPCQRAVVLTANSHGYQVALDLVAAGVDVAAVVDLRIEVKPTPLSKEVAEAGIEILLGHAVYEALPAAGKKRIRGAAVCPLDAAGKLRLDELKQLACDGIVMSVGWAGNVGLAYQAGARFHYDESIHQLVPKSAPDSLFLAGRANGLFDLTAKLQDGHRAGRAAAKYLGKFDGDPGNEVRHDGPAPSHPYPIFTHPRKKNFVDLDEDLHAADFVNAHQEGYDNVELLKRFSTVGMGPTQGKLSNVNAVRMLARLNDATINETGTTTSRPFYQPVPLGHLAGRRFHPTRHTPMHSWHVANDAELIHAGTWLRPEYYKAPNTNRADCILDEATNVRNNVGLMDVGTLGKLQVSGPDAVAFLERIYTGRFTKLDSGKFRYGLACDETGVIIEDGIVARLADDRFYLTATSSGAAAFYRELQRWAMIFDMNVTLVNATGQLAAMNIAGPRSRDVLESLTDVDLSPESFPYVGVRQGQVAGVSAMLMRVGFVGELGYEIHVPAASGLHVWTALMEAGHNHGIKPFGVEAQRLLRLEKGHLIVSQDTDALTNPFEADVAWAIGKNKPFFIGGRSLDIANKQPLTRRLVGLKFSADHSGPLPEECHLIVANGEMAGRITSIAHRSTMGHPLAMAFVRPDLADAGTQVQVRSDGGQFVNATVTALPFYDADNTRQRV